MICTARPVRVDAHLIAAADLEGAARWAGARLRGTSLPADERILQWDGPDGEEEARVGEWLVRLPTGRLVKHSNEEFELLYCPAAAPADPFAKQPAITVKAMDSNEWKVEIAAAHGRARIIFRLHGERFATVVVSAQDFLDAVRDRVCQDIATETDGTVLVVDPCFEGELRMRAEWRGYTFETFSYDEAAVVAAVTGRP